MSLSSRIGTLAIGHTLNWLFVNSFDWVLYPYVIWQCGLLVGGVTMSILSLIVCYATLLAYDWSKKDWLGLELLKEVREYNGGRKVGRVVSWVLSRGQWAILVFLSIKYDPFITVAYMRHGANQYNGMSHRDWKIFLSSWGIANLMWSVSVFTGVSFIEWMVVNLKGAFN